MKHVQHSASATGSSPASSAGSARRAAVKVACAGALSVTAMLIAACGGSATTSHTSTANLAVTQLPSTTTAGAGASAHGKAATHHDGVAAQTRPNQHYAQAKITTANHVQLPAAGTGGSTINDEHPASQGSRADSGRPSTSGVPNPCLLVSRAQAAAFIGKSVAVKEAPLGPTCIYQALGAKRPVTMAVERVDFSALKPRLKRLANLSIAGRTAYYGVYGSATLYVPLSGGRVLNVSAPWPVAPKFAAVALPKLGL